MLQLKVFYNISFPEGDRCEIISTEENEVASFKELMQVLRRKIDCLHFIPNEELRIQYKDDEDTFVSLRVGDSLNDAFRCAQAVSGTTFRTLKLKIQWQPRSTPEMVSCKRREISERMLAESGGESRKQLLFNVERSDLSVSGPNTNKSFLAEMNEPSSSECFSMGYGSDSKLPPVKQQRVGADRPDINNTGEEIVTLPVHSSDYKSPLDLLIEDKQVEVEKEREKVAELQGEVERLSAVYGRHPGVDYSKPACTNCHRREGHNRASHACHSSQFCGDLNKHKDEKDAVSFATNRLQCAKKRLQKLENALTMKLALKHQTVNSFSTVLRTRLISECRARYLTPQGFENWRQINIDLKKLEAHFKGKIPGNDVSLISALEEYNRKADLAGSEVGLCTGNPVRTLWELKGLKWPSSPEISSVCNSTPSHTGQLAPATIQEEQEQLKTALIESRMSNFYRPEVGDETVVTAVHESEKIPLSDAASALMNLSDFMGSRK